MLRLITLATLIGAAAGLRTTVAPAAVSWAAYLGRLDLGDSWLAFLGYTYTPFILTFVVLGELIADKLPFTESRTVPMQFSARILSGALCGAALGTAAGAVIVGIAFGIAGAVIGTLGGHAFRARLASAFGRDLPAAIIEDIIAIGGAVLIVMTVGWSG